MPPWVEHRSRPPKVRQYKYRGPPTNNQPRQRRRLGRDADSTQRSQEARNYTHVTKARPPCARRTSKSLLASPLSWAVPSQIRFSGDSDTSETFATAYCYLLISTDSLPASYPPSSIICSHDERAGGMLAPTPAPIRVRKIAVANAEE